MTRHSPRMSPRPHLCRLCSCAHRLGTNQTITAAMLRLQPAAQTYAWGRDAASSEVVQPPKQHTYNSSLENISDHERDGSVI
jgi:hypothetical protein